MASVIPPALAPYLHDCINTRSLTLLTSTLGTPTNWILVRFLYLSLHGQQSSIGSTGCSSAPTIGILPTGRKVILVSIWRPFELWNELARKCGLNLPEKISSKTLYYIDGLAKVRTTSAVPPPVSTQTTSPSESSHIILPSPTLKSLTQTLTNLTTSLQRENNESLATVTILIDGIDLLLGTDPLTSSTEILSLLTDLQSKVHNVVVTCSADEPLLHNMDAAATPLEYEHGVLARGLGHQAGWIVGVRGLETGFSREVDGTVRVGRGGGWDRGEGGELEDGGEWLFRAGGDGMVRVWGRGEA